MIRTTACRGWCLVAVALLVAASPARSEAATAGGGGGIPTRLEAQAAELELLWCQYGLADCSKGTVAAPAPATLATQPPEPRSTSADRQADGPAAAAGEAVLAAEQEPLPAADEQPKPSVQPAVLIEGAFAAAEQRLPPASAAEAAEEAPPADRSLMEGADGGAAHGTAATAVEEAFDTAAGEAATGISSVAAAAEAAAAGAVAVTDAAQTAAAAPVAVPAWALVLLGSSVALVAVVQLWHLLPHRGLLRQASEQAAAVQPSGPGTPQTVKPAATSVDVEAAAMAPLPDLPALPAPVKFTPAQASPPARPLVPALIKTFEQQQQQQKQQLAEPGALSLPASPRSPAAGPPPLDVDPSVTARDISRMAWVQAASGRAYRRTSEWHNPLFGGGASASGSPEVVGGIPAVGGSPAGAEGADLGDSWKAKTASMNAQLGKGDSEATGGDDFRLLAAALPEPSGSAAWAAPTPPVPLAAPGAGPAGWAGSIVGREVPQPSSPSKEAAGAARKLMGAKSVGPQELPSLEEGEGDGEAALAAGRSRAGPTNSATSASQAQCSTADGGLRPELSGGSTWTVHAAESAPLQLQPSTSATGSSSASMPAAAHGPRLLTAHQFRVDVKLHRLVGVGAAACVYAAEWEGRQVAVKLMHPTQAHAGAFAREVEVMAAAGAHPHIISLLAACLEPPLAVIQELAATSLHDQLHERHLRPQWGLFLQLAEDIAAALTHCHAQRPPIVHRDLSAKNILLAADGRARLADFGLAKRRRGDCLSADEGGALGTAAYMSVEAMQAGRITERCDVFSYAVLLWEMLAGQQAWSELASPMQIIYAVGVQRRRLPIPPGCPPPIARLLKDCWRHNAPLRPSFPEVLQRMRQLRSQDSFKLRGLLAPSSSSPAPTGGASSKAALPAWRLGGKAAVGRATPIAAHSGSSRPPRVTT